MAEKNNLLTASYDQIKDKIKPGEFSHYVQSNMGMKAVDEEIISDNKDISATFISFYKILSSEGL